MISVLTVNFAFADSTTRSYSLGNYNPENESIGNFKNRVKTFNSVDTVSGKKFTNLAEVLKSESGAALTGVKSATITTTQITRIYDATTYGG